MTDITMLHIIFTKRENKILNGRGGSFSFLLRFVRVTYKSEYDHEEVFIIEAGMTDILSIKANHCFIESKRFNVLEGIN